MANLVSVETSDTFEQWRVKTNLIIDDVNDLTGGGNVKIGASGIDVDFDNNDANSQFVLTIDGDTKLTIESNGNLQSTGSITSVGINSTGNIAVNTDKFVVTASNGNTAIAGTLSSLGNLTVGTNKLVVNASTGAVTIDGSITITGTVDGVDVSAFKTAYDNRPILRIFNVAGTQVFTM